MKRELFPIAVILCLLLAGLCQAERRTTKAQVNPEQAAPAPPPTLEEMPASPPQVTFRDGQLAIAATNSTLADILKAVRTQTGAVVDVPGNPTERVVGQFGPGPARDVLTSLLNGSHFNYVLLGSETNPNALDRVILMAKSSTTTGESSPGTPEPANAYMADRGGPVQPPMSAPGFATQQVTVEGQAADSADADADSSDDTQDADAEDSTDDSDTADQTDQAADQQGVADGQENGQQNVKTPEQMLQELQQQQQNQNQPQPGVPPGGMPPGLIPHMPPGGGPPH